MVFASARFLAFRAASPESPRSHSAQKSLKTSGLRSFEIVPLETVSETSANASIGDLNGDAHLDIVLVKGRQHSHRRKKYDDGTNR